MKISVVDKQTGKIVGAEKGSKEYWHEVAHIEYDKTDQGIKNGFFEEFAFYCSLGVLFLYLILDKFIKIDYLLYFAALIYIISVGYFLYEEYWCWKYAEERKK